MDWPLSNLVCASCNLDLVLKLTQTDQYHEMLELQIYSRSLTLILHDFTYLMNFCSKETRASITHLAPSQVQVIRGTVRLRLGSKRTKLIVCIATWMRLVAKGISVERDPNTGRAISIDTPVISTKQRPDQAWFNFAFVLVEENSGPNKQATLLCFDAPTQLHKEFNDLAISDEQLDNSYFVFSVVLKVIWKVMDDVSWTLADVFRNIEKVRRPLWKDVGKLADWRRALWTEQQTTRAQHSRSTSPSCTTSPSTIYTCLRHLKLHRLSRATSCSHIAGGSPQQAYHQLLEKQSKGYYTVHAYSKHHTCGLLVWRNG